MAVNIQALNISILNFMKYTLLDTKGQMGPNTITVCVFNAVLHLSSIPEDSKINLRVKLHYNSNKL